METFGNKFPAFSGIKSSLKFCCEKCDFNSSKKSHYIEHLSTLKHKNTLLGDAPETVSGIFRPDGKFNCNICSRAYKSRNGLWKHKKTCLQDKDCDKESIISDKELMMMLIKQNEKLMNIVETGTHNTNNSNNNNNSHNKTFNLQFFLNETCKNAINMSDFINSLNVSITDLENTSR